MGNNYTNYYYISTAGSLLSDMVIKFLLRSNTSSSTYTKILNKILLLPKQLYLSYKEASLNYITEYLYQLVCLYNKFYNDNNVLNEVDMVKRESYIAMTKLVYNICHNILEILAIDEVEKM